MNKSCLLVVSLISFFLSSLSPASAIENGDSALGHPRIISTNPGGGSAFLYSDRIVFTQGHAVDGKSLDFFQIAPPGTRTNRDGIHYQVVKAFVAEGYREWNPRYDWARPNDFAILILDRPVPNTSKAKLASKELIDELRATGATVSVGGYGFQSAEDRAIRENGFASVEPKISSHAFANGEYLAPALKAQAAAWPGFNRPSDLPDYLKYHVYAPLGGPSTCDGDSGSGYFLDEDGVFTYLGTQGSHLGIPNCGMDDRIGIIPLQGINPVYKYLELIAEAETWVAAHPVKPAALQATLKYANSTALSANLKKQIRALVENHPVAKKFVCTGIRYKTQPKIDSIRERAKAKAACGYALELNPGLNTWFQTKTTNSKSYAGRVLLTVKY